uniref:Uncharacterized protein n=1 Tax=Cacopsylla melanoneura TaxID=428564 RepID=A0A8D9BBH9_9HEMI
MFDNELFETRLPEEWIASARKNKQQYAVPARAFLAHAPEYRTGMPCLTFPDINYYSRRLHSTMFDLSTLFPDINYSRQLRSTMFDLSRHQFSLALPLEEEN